MKLDAFFGRKNGSRKKSKDEVDLAIEKIERFAPAKYREERKSFYYNYRILGLYLKPLIALLETLSKKQRLNEDREDFLHEIFLKLKAFYDPRDRLSLAETMEDRNFRVKFKDIFLFFYEIEAPPDMDSKRWVKGN